MFNQGEYENVLKILDINDIKNESELNIQDIKIAKENIAKGVNIINQNKQLLEQSLVQLNNRIEEIKFRIQTEELERKEGWELRIFELLKVIVEYKKEILGEDLESYIKDLVSLSRKSIALGFNPEFLGEADTLCKKKFGEWHPLRIPILLTYDLLIVYEYSCDQKYILDVINIIRRNYFIKYFPSFFFRIPLIRFIFTKLSFKKTHGKFPELGEIYREIGNAFRERGENYLNDLEDKLYWYLESHKVIKKFYDKFHPETLKSYLLLGYAYASLYKFRKALKYLFKVLNTYNKIKGLDPPFLALLLSNIASIYRAKGNSKKALEYDLKALELRKNFFGDNNEETVYSYMLVGLSYKKHRMYQKSQEYFSKALELVNINNPFIIDIYENIGLLNIEMGLIENGLSHLRKAKEIAKKIKSKIIFIPDNYLDFENWVIKDCRMTWETRDRIQKLIENYENV